MELVQDGCSLPYATTCFLCHLPIVPKTSLGEDVLWTWLVTLSEVLVPIHDACLGYRAENWRLTDTA